MNGWKRGDGGYYRHPDPRFAGIIIRRRHVGAFAWSAWFNEGDGAVCGVGHTLTECIADIKPSGQMQP
jgi:hypothetical protein